MKILRQSQEDVKRIPIGDIEDNIYHNLKGLEEVKFPNEALSFDPSSIVTRASKGRTKLFERQLPAWTDLPTDEIPKRLRASVISNCLSRVQSLVSRVRNKSTRREWTSFPSPLYKGGKQKGFFGFVVVDKRSRAVQDVFSHGLKKVHAALDFSYDDNSSLECSLTRLAKISLEVFHCQPDRRFFIGISIVGSSALLAVFNRSGMFLSDTFNIHHQPERFVRLVMGVAFVNRTGLGYDPSVHITPFEGSRGGFVRVNKVSYNIVETIHVSETIVGRATLCLKVRRLGRTFVIKNSWLEPEYATREIDSLSSLREVRGVPELVMHEMIRSESGPMDNTAIGIDALMAKGLLDDRKVSVILQTSAGATSSSCDGVIRFTTLGH